MAATAAPATAQGSGTVELPVELHGDRFFAVPVTTAGARVKLLLDTGGGLYLHTSAAARVGVGLSSAPKDGEKVLLPPFQAGRGVPPPLPNGGRIGLMAPERGWSADGDSDGMLGQAWFGDRVWTIDYPGRTLTLHAQAPPPAGTRVPLGFARTKDGRRGSNFPRIEVLIDGAQVDLLFDTGATVKLSSAALSAIGDGGPKVRATSFIVRSLFERWRKAHPDWRVLAVAEAATSEPMIEVPEVTVAGHRVGPVWFTRREDGNFHDWMSSMMDRRIEGALGGNALRHFRITVDYPGAQAFFERPASPT